VVGRFGADGCGRFTGDDVHEGRPIRVVYLWSEIMADSCRWEQAFSADGGATWETNWIMEFSRIDALHDVAGPRGCDTRTGRDLA
jgi:hypothetical protein